MNTLPLSPSWWAEVAADVATLPACSYPEATYWPLREAIAGYTGLPAGADRAGGRRRRDHPAGRAARARAAATWPSSRSRRTSSTPSPPAPPARAWRRWSRARAALGLDLDGRPGARPRGAPGLALLAQQPDRRGGAGRDRQRALRRVPGRRARRPGLPGARRRGPVGAGRAPREPRRRAHLLQGLGARRHPLRLRPRQPGPGRGARRPAPARLASPRRPRARPSWPARRAADMRVDAAAIRAERDRLADGDRAPSSLEVVGGAGNYVTFRTPWSGDGGVRRARVARARRPQLRPRAAARGRHPRLDRHAAGERPPRRRPRRAAGAAGADPRTARTGRRLGPARHGVPPHARDDHRRAGRPRRQRALDGGAPASASSTTC